MNAFVTLIKREFWESKSLWAVPLAAAALIIGTSIFGKFRFGGDMPPGVRDIAGSALVGITVFLAVVGGITIFTYLTDCLFSERKDRSILFWKSLPVSDARTVLSKLAVAMLVLPLGLMVLAVITHFVVSAIMLVRFEDVQQFAALGSGYWSGWANALGRTVVACCFALLWYLPLAAYLMLASVIAKRAPLMYVILPPVVLALWERLMLETSHIAQFITGRLAPRDAEQLLNPRGDAWQAFQDPALWIGLAVGAGMLYIVIRLRRYRDDT
jgi:ABC-2 type transport system permease protein